MLISIHDRSLMRVAFIDNAKPKALHFYNDSWDRHLKEATSTFSFSISKTGHENERFLNIENYVSFQYKGVDFLFSIMKIEENEKEFKIFTENLNFELLNETKKPINITVSQNLVWYLKNDFLLETAGLKLGVNELSDQTRKIKLESEQTALARLLSIVNQFNGELEFITKLKPNGTLDSITLNVYKAYEDTRQGVGTQRQDVILYYGKNIDTITRTVDKTGVFNGIRPIGKDGLTIISIDREIKNSDGIVEFYTHKNGTLYAPISKDMFPSQMAPDNDDRWSIKDYSADDTDNVETLFSLGLNELKKIAYPALSYEISGFYDLEIGDTFQVNDNGFTPALLLKMRVAQQKISFTQPQNNKTVVGNVKALESGISSDLADRMKQLADEVAPYRFEIVSDNGLTFKNSQGSTTLTARVYKGVNVDEVTVDSFDWYLNGTKFGGTDKSQTIKSSDISGTATVRFSAKLNGLAIGGLEVTVQEVSDGEQGEPGRGITTKQQKWQVTDTSDKPSDSWSSAKWSDTLVPATSSNKYLWMIERTTYTDNTNSDLITLNGVYGDTGNKGDNGAPTGVVGLDTEPNEKFEGMLWKYTGTDNLPVTGLTAQSGVTYIWRKNTWVVYEIVADNLKVDRISSITSILGDVTAGTYTSWTYSTSGSANNYLNGIYLYDGHLRDISIENPSSRNPEVALSSRSYLVRGTDVYGGIIRFYTNSITTSLTPNQLLKESTFFSASNLASTLDTTRDANGSSILNISADNLRVSGYVSQNTSWIKMSAFSSYRIAFGTITISVGIQTGSSSANVSLGSVPMNCRPATDRMFSALAWSINTNLDRHVQVSSANASVYLINPAPNTLYSFEISWPITF